MTALRILKHSVIIGAKSLGLLRILGNSGWRRRRLLILCYHGISQKDEHRWSNLFISPEFLRERLAILSRRGYHVLPLASAAEQLQANALPPKSVVITFDDGFYDFYQHAIPALKSQDMPATLYLTTYYAGRPYPIFNLILSYLLWRGAGKTLDCTPWGLPESVVLGASARDNRKLEVALLKAVKSRGYGPEEQTEAAAEIAGKLGVDFNELMELRVLQLMNGDEVAHAASLGADIQLHTHRHRIPDDKEKFIREIVDNREWILRQAGIETAHFCYPSGRYHSDCLPWLRSQGILTATTCDHALATKEDDPLLLPRFLDSMAVSPSEFESWLSGFSEILPHRRTYVPVQALAVPGS